MSIDEGPAYVADLGADAVRVFLLEQVEGDRRMVASVSVSVPNPAVPSALAETFEEAAKQILEFSSGLDEPPTTAWHLLTDCPEVPRTLVVAPRDNRFCNGILDVLRQTCIHLLEPLYVGGRKAPALDRVAQHLKDVEPDIIVLLCPPGTKEWLPVKAVAELLAHGAIGTKVPCPVIVGEIPEVLDGVTEALGPLLPPGSVPATNGKELIGNLKFLHHRRAEIALERDGIRHPQTASGSTSLISSAAEMRSRVSPLLARRYELDAYVIDIGQSYGAVYVADQEESTNYLRLDLGGQHGPATVLREIGVNGVLRWLPVDVPADRLEEVAKQRVIYPNCPATTLEELLIEHAFLREQVHLLVTESQRHVGDGPGAVGRPMDLLVAAGSALARTPRIMQTLLILLDTLQPEGLTNLAVDRTGALSVLGLLGSSLEGSVAPRLEGDAVLNAGLLVAPVGHSSEGQTAISLEVAYADRAPVKAEVPYGSLSVVVLPPGEQAALKLWPDRELDIGLGPGNAATPRFEIEGGSVGIVVDARGRPLELPEDVDQRQARLLHWFQSTNAYPPVSFVPAPDPDSGSSVN